MSETRVKETLERVCAQLKVKYSSLSELNALTQELKEHLSRNDKVATRLLLRNRSELVEKMQVCDKEIEKILIKEPEIDARKISLLLRGQVVESGYDDDENYQDIIVLIEGTKRLWEKVRSEDKLINERLVGNRSVYNKGAGV